MESHRRKIRTAAGLLGFVAISGLLGVSWGILGDRKSHEGSTRNGPGETALDELLDVMRQRLLVMHKVARWKWNEGKPITDREREEQLLANLEQRAVEAGFGGQRIRAFMAAQIEAGKLIQEADFAAWKKQGRGKFEQISDLYADLRPRIDELNERMLAVLAKILREPNCKLDIAVVEKRARAVLVGEGIDDGVRAVAIRPIVAGAAE